MSYQDIGLLTIAEIVGDFGFKRFANHGGHEAFLTGITGYVGVVYFLIRSLQGSQVLLVNAAWDGLSAVIESLAAIFILGEYYNDPLQYVGLVMIILGIYFLKIPIFRKHKFLFPSLK